MTTREELKALAETVQKLTGPDREVDWRIADALGEVPDHVIQGPMGTPYGWFRREDQWSLTRTKESDVYAGVESWSPKPRTADINAAMSLVPEGYSWTLGQNVHHKHWLCSINYVNDEGEPTCLADSASRATPALTLTAAALLARAEQMGEA